MIIRITSILAIAVLCASCYTDGHKFDMDDVGKLVPGQTTFQEAKELLGPPTATIFGADGTMLYGWSYISAGAFRATDIGVTILFDDKAIMAKVQHQPNNTVSTR